ncbi:MAG: peptidylprolyl isomerase [Acidobacteriota bacterium]|nr:MAG: peptidylprolyl isomerase [Acidobacteriota bacterium]
MLKYFRNRRSMGWLMGSSMLVLVIFAFIAFYVPDFLAPGDQLGSPTGAVAWVDGEPISSQEFLQGYRLQDAQYRQQLGAQYSPDLLRQLGLDNFVMQRLVQDKVLTLEAERLGLTVADSEVSQNILRDPTLQQDGQFIGKEAYMGLFAGSGMTPTMYEEQVRQEILRQKLQALVTDGVVVTGADVEDEYRRRNEKVHLEYAVIARSDFENELQVTDDEVREYYDENQAEFERPVQRKARFITFTPQLFTGKVTVTQREITRYYNENQPQYSTGEQVRASHILFKTGPDKDEDAVRQRAEAVLAEVKSGADFAELAREHSEDTSAASGGDLGLFGKGAMVPEFERAAFSLPIGGTSELVRSSYGYHIIKVTEKEPAFTQPLETVQEQIQGVLSQEKATEAMEAAIESAAEKLRAAGSIDALTAEYPLLVPQDTPFFGADDPLPQLGNSIEATRRVFEADVLDVTPAIPLGAGGGYVFLQVLEEREAGVAPFEEVKNQAREQLRKQRAMELARNRADEARQQLMSKGGDGGDIEFLTNESYFRGSQLPEVGRSIAVERRAFEMPVGELSPPLVSDNGYVLIRVLEKSGFDAEDFNEQRASFEEQILTEQRSRVWSAFVQNLQSRYDVQIDWRAIRGITGG